MTGPAGHGLCGCRSVEGNCQPQCAKRKTQNGSVSVFSVFAERRNPFLDPPQVRSCRLVVRHPCRTRSRKPSPTDPSTLHRLARKEQSQLQALASAAPASASPSSSAVVPASAPRSQSIHRGKSNCAVPNAADRRAGINERVCICVCVCVFLFVFVSSSLASGRGSALKVDANTGQIGKQAPLLCSVTAGNTRLQRVDASSIAVGSSTLSPPAAPKHSPRHRPRLSHAPQPTVSGSVWVSLQDRVRHGCRTTSLHERTCGGSSSPTRAGPHTGTSLRTLWLSLWRGVHLPP